MTSGDFAGHTLSALIAEDRRLASVDYRDVIRELKKGQLVGEAVLPHYQKRIADLESLITEHGVVTLPHRAMRVRLASQAESAAIPAAHMRPPRLIGNTGEVGEFVLPLRIPGEDGTEEIGFDDFTCAARPGHPSPCPPRLVLAGGSLGERRGHGGMAPPKETPA